jgi:hypothetical protein
MEKKKRGRPRKPVEARKRMTKEEALAVFRAWQERNADEIARANNDRLEAGLGKANAIAAKARAMALSALPAWSDLKAIQGIYAEAARKGLVVDHEIPLVGKDKQGKKGKQIVCGLHVPENLALLTKAENQKKGNRYSPD